MVPIKVLEERGCTYSQQEHIEWLSSYTFTCDKEQEAFIDLDGNKVQHSIDQLRLDDQKERHPSNSSVVMLYLVLTLVLTAPNWFTKVIFDEQPCRLSQSLNDAIETDFQSLVK